ncbi:hypothetical protein ACHAXA_003468 [Cyclostephanos tholiformis]|uniref:Uncharacterized protein n=1 Tax=Cyclostephanos tholiformis TaxID=382380 RepID=A0ABD3R1D2_9STRA
MMSSPPHSTPAPAPAPALATKPPPTATAPGTESIQYIGRYLGLFEPAVRTTDSSSSSSALGGGKMSYIKKIGFGIRELQLENGTIPRREGGEEEEDETVNGGMVRPPRRKRSVVDAMTDRSGRGWSSTAAGARRGEEDEVDDDDDDDDDDDEEEEECRRLKFEADVACKRVGRRYDALLRFVRSHPKGEYEEFVEFLLMGGGIPGVEERGGGGGSASSSEDDEEYFRDLSNEDFYDARSECRKLWNDNLTLGLPASASTAEGRAFVPAAKSSHQGRGASSSEDESRGYLGRYLRDRTLSEGERIKNHIVQVDREKIKQGLGSAIGVISSVSSYALKPLRDLQLAEKLNALNIDMEEEEQRKEIAHHNRMMEERRDMEAMMRLRYEAEERCLNATTEHLMGFIKNNPHAKYHQWIEDLHPENAHDGTLLEGMGKTIDHRFFVEESDHRRIWNDNLLTFLDPDKSTGRDYVPARARQMDEYGESVVAADILSGSVVGGERIPITPLDDAGQSNSDLMQFDW